MILSLFPGIGMLDMAFEQEGYCVVRGPDVLWGGDVRRFHPPSGVFEGVIGGPPCQAFSCMAALVRANGYEPRYGNLIPEYERCVYEARSAWFLMENVPAAPVPCVEGYRVHDQLLDNRWLGEEQQRKRRISFGTRDGRPLHIQYAALELAVRYVAVTGRGGFGPNTRDKLKRQETFAVGAGHSAHPYRRDMEGVVTSSDGAGKVRMTRYTLERALELQGLPPDFLKHAPFTREGASRVVANGVPIPMGRAIAQAIRRAMS